MFFNLIAIVFGVKNKELSKTVFKSIHETLDSMSIGSDPSEYHVWFRVESLLEIKIPQDKSVVEFQEHSQKSQ